MNEQYMSRETHMHIIGALSTCAQWLHYMKQGKRTDPHARSNPDLESTIVLMSRIRVPYPLTREQGAKMREVVGDLENFPHEFRAYAVARMSDQLPPTHRHNDVFALLYDNLKPL